MTCHEQDLWVWMSALLQHQHRTGRSGAQGRLFRAICRFYRF